MEYIKLSYHHLNFEDRTALMLESRKEGFSARKFAELIKRHPSTIYRELKRNSINDVYQAQYASDNTFARRRRGHRKLKIDSILWKFIVEAIRCLWSPQQIAKRLKTFPDLDQTMNVSHTTIYSTIRALPKGELKKDLLSKVKSEDIRRRVVYAVLANIDLDLAEYVAKELGIKTPPKQQDSLHQPVIASSKRLSTSSFPASDIKQRKIALLVHNGVNASSIDDIKIWAEAEKAIVETLAPNAAPVKSSDGNEIPVDGRQNGEPSVTYDAVIVIDGNNLEVFKADGVSKHYVLETYKHLKPIVFLGDKCALIDEFQLTKDAALFSTQNFKEIQDQFKQAIQNHRLWDREKVVAAIPA